MKGRRATPNSQPAWFQSIQVGSVIAEPNGPYRIVREVTRTETGALRAVSLLIRRCSWTGRCYTVLFAADLKTRRFRLVPVRPVTLKGEFHALATKAIHQPAGEPYVLRCCDVRGIP